ncbi:hypothetical protein OG765_27880 [Streptomyces sp. NBC_00555]|uniref:hypothetical protein n=1 Tax=Streptomyces sp. NBC_00555 TaxID=2903662 RepID=UPI00225A0269|nr:hypothetical protein [Streptomyces sp. NBC_00555]MCX5014781.1 hypothetical protein [Streptomyces sp. NBC_00555]
MTVTTAWPAGVIARYLTKAAEILADPEATVDVRKNRDFGHSYDCRGCGVGGSSGNDVEIHAKAQAHAATCRAIPRPTA